MRRRSASRAPSSISTTCTSNPVRAATSAIPEPISPQPTTPTLLMGERYRTRRSRLADHPEVVGRLQGGEDPPAHLVGRAHAVDGDQELALRQPRQPGPGLLVVEGQPAGN